jgi:class 3 adenylate cyclase
VEKFGIIHFLQTIIESERILVPVIESHDGIILKVEGDSMLVIFRNPMKAIAGAIEMQRATHRYNKNVPAEEKILLCVGIGYGRMLRIGDSDVFGVEVNSASKLGEDTAKSGEIMVTEAVRKSAEKRAGLSFSPIADVPAGTGKAFLVKYSLPK